MKAQHAKLKWILGFIHFIAIAAENGFNRLSVPSDNGLAGAWIWI